MQAAMGCPIIAVKMCITSLQSLDCPLDWYLDLVIIIAVLLKMMEDLGPVCAAPQVFIRGALTCSATGTQEQETRQVDAL